MLNIGIQYFGGRGGGGSGGARGGGRAGGGGGGSQSGAAKVASDLRTAMEESPGMREYAATQVLDEAPVGTKVYTGGNSLTDRSGSWGKESTFWEKTSSYGWTRFGDTANYDPITSNRVAKELNKKKNAGSLNIRVTS